MNSLEDELWTGTMLCTGLTRVDGVEDAGAHGVKGVVGDCGAGWVRAGCQTDSG